MKDIDIIIPPKAVSKIYTSSLVLASLFLFASLTHATTPNPGHPWTDIGNGNWQVNNTQTGTRTFTFPDADTTVSGSLGPIKAGTIPYGNGTAVIATTSAGTPGFVLALLNGVPTWAATTTLSTITIPSLLTLARGGSGVALSAVNGGITYSNASTLANSAVGSVGRVLQSAGAATPTWSTATYPVTAGTSGNVLRSDGTNWSSIPPPGSFIGSQVFTASGTYTPTSAANTAVAVFVGGGGGGGGVTGVASSVGAAGGGGAGSVGVIIRGGGLGLGALASFTITVGPGGTAGTTAGGNGGVGGDTTVDWGNGTGVAKGGTGGTGQVAGTTLASVVGGGGTAATGLVTGAGHPGFMGYRASGIFGWSGSGGSSPYGGGGLGRTTAGAGAAATGFGGGGGGALSTAAVAQAGGSGSGGLVIIYEYR